MEIKRSLWCRKRLVALVAMTLLFAACKQSPEAKSAKFMAEGKKLLEKKDPTRAILQFRNAIQVMPRDPEAYYELGVASVDAGDARQGVIALRKALELNPKHAGAQLSLASLMTNSNDPDVLKDAQQRLQALLLDSPKDADTLHALALTELKLGEADEAEQNLELAVSSAPHELVFVVTLAQAKLAQKDPKGAEAIFKKACADFPKAPEAFVILGRFYSSQNRAAEAEQQFRQALAMDPQNGPGLLNLASLLMRTGRNTEAEEAVKKLSGRPEPTYELVYANFLFQRGRPDEGIRELERLTKQDPDNRLVRTRLVAAYQSAGKVADAQRILTDALKKNQKDLDAVLQRGELSLQAGKPVEAEGDFNTVLRLKPDSPEVHYALAKLYQSRGESLRQREELTAALNYNPSLLKVRLELAALLVADKAGQAALDTLNEAPADQRRLVAVVAERNWAYLSMDKLADAQKGVDAALAATRTPDLLLQDAILKIDAKRYSEARQSLHELLGKNPEDVRALQALVRSYALQNQTRTAVDEVKAYAAAHSKSANVQYFLGDLLLQTGDKAGARQALAATKQIDPNYTPADLSLAQLDLLQSDWKDARPELNAILSKNGEDALARLWMGMLEASVGDQAAAIADFRRVIDAQPGNAIALNNLAYLLAESGNQTEEPLKYAEKAVELDPGNPDFEGTLGWVLYRRGVYDLSVKHLESSVSKKSTALRNYHLAMAYNKAGKAERGRAALTVALRMDASLPEAKVAQAMFGPQASATVARP